MLGHFNRRVRNAAAINFPVSDLIGLLESGSTTTVVCSLSLRSFSFKNVALVYIRMAKPKLSEDDHLAYLPALLHAARRRAPLTPEKKHEIYRFDERKWEWLQCARTLSPGISNHGKVGPKEVANIGFF